MLLTNLSDSELFSELQSVLVSRNRATALLLEYLGEVEARRLHLKEAYPSMYEFCLRGLGFSEGSAVRHIAAARMCRRFPVALAFVCDGRLHMTGMALLKPHLTDDNHLELLAAASGRSKAEIELLLRARHPRPDVPESIRPVMALGDACFAGATGAVSRDTDRAGSPEAKDAVSRDADCAASEARGADGADAVGADGVAVGRASCAAGGAVAEHFAGSVRAGRRAVHV